MKGFATWLVLILVAIVIGIGAYFYVVKPNNSISIQQTATTTQTVGQTQTAQSPKTSNVSGTQIASSSTTRSTSSLYDTNVADWKTYNPFEKGFQLKYPANLKLEVDNNIATETEDMHGLPRYIGSAMIDLNDGYIVIRTLDNHVYETPEEYIKNDIDYHSYKDFTVSGYRALQYDQPIGGGPYGYTRTTALWTNGINVIEISYTGSGFYSIDESHEPPNIDAHVDQSNPNIRLYNEILSTFKLTS